MSAQLDTSGVVNIVERDGPTGSLILHYQWADLSPFAQGYVEALFAGAHPDTLEIHGSEDTYRQAGFSNLSPEALAMILRDCEEHLKTYGLAAGDPRLPARGRWFWKNRQTGMWAKSEAGLVGGFPPLRVYLNDDGKVMLAEA